MPVCRFVLAAWLSLAFASSPAVAQSTGSVQGRVVDERGAPVAGASVYVVNLFRGHLGAITEADGAYVIRGVPAGTYFLGVAHVAYSAFWLRDLIVPVGQQVWVEATLPERKLHNETDLTYDEYRQLFSPAPAPDVPTLLSGMRLMTRPIRSLDEVVADEPGVVHREGDPSIYYGEIGASGFKIPDPRLPTGAPWTIYGHEQAPTYYLDGLRLDGAPFLALTALEHLQADLTPGSARYGNAAAGVVHLTTRGPHHLRYAAAEGGLNNAFGYRDASLALGTASEQGRVVLFATGRYAQWDDADPRAGGAMRLRPGQLARVRAAPQSILAQDPEGNPVYLPLPRQVGAGAVVRQTAQGIVASDGTVLSPTSGYTLLSPNPVLTAHTLGPEAFTTALAKRGREKQRGEVYGYVAVRPWDGTQLQVSGRYFDQVRQRLHPAYVLYAPDDAQREHTTHHHGRVMLRQHLGPRRFLEVQASYRAEALVRHDPAFSERVSDVLRYGDLEAPANALARDYLRQEGAQYVYRYQDGFLPDADDIHSLYAPPGIGQIPYYKQHRSAWRLAAHAEAEVGGWPLGLGGDYEQETLRAFEVSAPANLARVGADTYDALIFPTMNSVAQWIGYDHLGLRTTDRDHAGGFASRTQSAVAPFQPQRYGAYLETHQTLFKGENHLGLNLSQLDLYLGVRLDGYDSRNRVLYDPYALYEIERAGTLDARPASVGPDFAVYRDPQQALVGYRDRQGRYYDATGARASRQDVRGDLEGRPTVRTHDLFEPALQVTEGVFRPRAPDLNVLPRFGIRVRFYEQYQFFFNYARYVAHPPALSHATVQQYDQATRAFITLPNGNLKATRHDDIRLGGQAMVQPGFDLRLVLFRRDLRGALGTRTVLAFPGRYLTTDNIHDVTIQGFTVSLRLADHHGFSGQAHYTYSASTRIQVEEDAEDEKTILFRHTAAFDRPHQVQVAVDFAAAALAPTLRGLRASGVFRFASGFPYTPRLNPELLFTGRTGEARAEVNSSRMPAHRRLDLGLSYTLPLAAGWQLHCYGWVQNLFDRDNVLEVYAETGAPDDDGVLRAEAGQMFLDRLSASGGEPIAESFAAHYQAALRNPLHYGLPRQVQLGLRVTF